MITIIPKTRINTLEELDMMIGALQDTRCLHRRKDHLIEMNDEVYINKDAPTLGRFTDQLKGEKLVVLKVDKEKGLAHLGYSVHEYAMECVYCFVELKYLTKVVE
jgi:hypothetical protein